MAKLPDFKVGMGHADACCAYSALEVRADDAFGHVGRAGLFECQR